jgi:hypothetical protein
MNENPKSLQSQQRAVEAPQFPTKIAIVIIVFSTTHHIHHVPQSKINKYDHLAQVIPKLYNLG